MCECECEEREGKVRDGRTAFLRVCMRIHACMRERSRKIGNRDIERRPRGRVCECEEERKDKERETGEL